MKTVLVRGMFLLAFAAGCGPSEELGLASEDMGAAEQPLEEDNGLTSNGLAFNGLAFNGLAFNGLAFNGLSSSSFANWFNQQPTQANLFMKYLVKCAVPAGQTRTYTSGSTTYTWPGSMGLAPGWSSGAPATVDEQQTVSACLGALTNKYGQSVLVSLLGTTAQGQLIPTSASEMSTYTLREGCFFGNLFNGKGLFVGNDQGLLSPTQSSLRACALKGEDACPPLEHIGSCHSICQHDGTGTYFAKCTYQGVTYHALTTRLRPQDIYTCGDGICQPTESCGTKDRADSCKNDCGRCH